MNKIVKFSENKLRLIEQYAGASTMEVITKHTNDGTESEPVDLTYDELLKLLVNMSMPYNMSLRNNKITLDKYYTIVEYKDGQYVMESNNGHKIILNSYGDIARFIERKEWVTDSVAVKHMRYGIPYHIYDIGSKFYIDWDYLNKCKDCIIKLKCYNEKDKLIGYIISTNGSEDYFISRDNLVNNVHINKMRVLNGTYRGNINRHCITPDISVKSIRM